MSEEIVTEFQYRLLNPLPYSSGGDIIDGTFITLSAPSSRNSKECAKLKQAFFRSIDQNAEVDEDAKEAAAESEHTGEGVMIMLAMSKDVELDDVMDTARRLFTSGNNIAMVEGEGKLTSPLVDKMTMDDFEKMTGEYMLRFILASALAKMNPK